MLVGVPHSCSRGSLYKAPTRLAILVDDLSEREDDAIQVCDHREVGSPTRSTWATAEPPLIGLADD